MSCRFLITVCVLCVAILPWQPAFGGLITTQVVEDKGTLTIPNGHYEKVFGSHMSADLGPEWGELAGHYERKNSEKLVWKNDGPPTVLHFANVYPKETHVPQTPAPNPYHIDSFFDIFTELNVGDLLLPLEPGMQIEEGTDTYFEGSSGTRYPGQVTPINDLNLLPTSTSNGTQIVWDLSRFATLTGNFYLIEYELPPVEIANVPEPAALVPTILGLAIFLFIGSSRRNDNRCGQICSGGHAARA
jgi:hypothetical protein